MPKGAKQGNRNGAGNRGKKRGGKLVAAGILGAGAVGGAAGYMLGSDDSGRTLGKIEGYTKGVRHTVQAAIKINRKINGG
jgi:hypothetical protein